MKRWFDLICVINNTLDENVGLTCYVLLLLMFEKIMDPDSEWKPACLETTINFANLPFECIKFYIKF